MAGAGGWGLVAPPLSASLERERDPHRGGAADRYSPAPLKSTGCPQIFQGRGTLSICGSAAWARATTHHPHPPDKPNPPEPSRAAGSQGQPPLGDGTGRGGGGEKGSTGSPLALAVACTPPVSSVFAETFFPRVRSTPCPARSRTPPPRPPRPAPPA
ncbi:hypothetical protein SipoB123_42515 [Streptomyces ipomoeae]|nr:hypothetical protein SipoB123_42515 [Streptomyces ipomoeae]